MPLERSQMPQDGFWGYLPCAGTFECPRTETVLFCPITRHMNDSPIEADVIPETQAVALRPQAGAVGILRPAGSLDAIAEAFKEYQAVCERILTKDDYQLYEKKPRKKKSAWRKLATAFNVSTEKVAEDIQRVDGHVVSARYTIRAFTPTRRMEAEGFCEVHEKCCPCARGEKCHKAAWKGHYCCQKDCDGRKHWSHPEHDIIATAQTRATNRAIADLIGCGEVSAEELVDEEPKTAAPPPPPPTPVPKPPPPKPVPCATQEQKTKLLNLLESSRELATEFLCKLGWLLPTETLEDLELRYVPSTMREMGMLKERMAEFGNGEQVGKPYEPHWETEAKPVAAVTPVTPAPKPNSVPSDQSWRDVIVTVPRKGMKKMEYEAHPDTIGSLFDLRHGNDEEAESARRRLWWLAKEWKPEPREFKGKVYQPSQADFKAREALDAFLVFFERNHPDEKL